MKVIIEGTDGVGKSSVCQSLAEYFQGKQLFNVLNHKVVPFPMEFLDREKTVVSANMLFDISDEVRVANITKYLAENDAVILFMVNNDGEELLRRIRERGNVDKEFDLDAPKYNELYLKTFRQLAENKDLEGRIALCDMTGLDKEESFHLVSYQLWRILSLRCLREKVCIGTDIQQFLNPVEK